MSTACFLDVETTGLSPRTEEIVELAMVLFKYDPATGAILRTMSSYTGLREPHVPITPGAARVHGLTLETLRGKDLDFTYVADLLGQSQLLIAHNASFDRPFVTRLFPQAVHIPWACSCKDIPWRVYGQPSARLESLTRSFGIRSSQLHRALADVDDAVALLATIGPHGRPFMFDLVQAARRDGRL
ncbi:MAG: exonuclease domain-containing protein [Clostridia bacterium]|nr:exonuclease domain-containing protein [Clostridia bacterium]